jgi:cytochrome c-type biogenesis protein
MTTNGPAALFFAFGGGLVSFLSPCTLPLVPGYLSYITGLSAEELKDRSHTNTVVGAATLFVLGFALIFVALGATASYFGHLLQPHVATLIRVAGAFIIFMALVMLGVFRIPLLAMEKRFQLGRELGIWSAFPLGMAFAFGWTPCIGPVLSAILAAATTDGSAQKGALLLFVYALGLGLPFLVMALFAGRVLGSLNWFKRHYLAVNRTGGAILLFMGVALLMHRWTELLGPVLRWYAQLNLPT